jgi:hypothetical protein
MREQRQGLLQRGWQQVKDYGNRIGRGNDQAAETLSVPPQFEGAVQVALPKVEPSARFRENLRGNLALAAQHKMTGFVIEYPRPFREGIILAISAGLLAVVGGTILLVILRSRPAAKGWK